MKSSISNPQDYDIVILGSGAGGKLMAWTSAQKGQRVVTIEREYVGGSCPNIACLPPVPIQWPRPGESENKRKAWGSVLWAGWPALLVYILLDFSYLAYRLAT
jgi:flavin-dependent dehydrogenase